LLVFVGLGLRRAYGGWEMVVEDLVVVVVVIDRRLCECWSCGSCRCVVSCRIVS
jgi:hypothetical protein